MKIVVQLVLWVIIGVLGYLVFNSVNGPVKFNKIKQARYAKAVENLRDIRTAQLAYRSVTGKFAKDPVKLVAFIDTAKFTLTQRRDSSYIAFNKILKIDEPRDTVIVDTLGYASVKDSLFKTGNHKNMIKIPIEGVESNFEMDAGFINKNDLRIPVFEAKVAKDILLHDQDKDLLAQEKEVRSVDEVNGGFLSVGSMTEVMTSGNWPRTYGANDQ
ncbi:type II secretion system protein [Aquimarina sp. AU58]|uniref:type II secretion system protein n=1 Tax=Aquimarina sp. AU58 TaxID=1874112 RepID=UPI000D6E60C0|nr:hypothetical protein [Aquimarina sp. AU58]